MVVGAAAATTFVLLVALDRATRPPTKPTGAAPRQTNDRPFLPVWEATKGTAKDRMLRTTVGGKPLHEDWYQAIWARGDDRFLVVLRPTRLYLFDTQDRLSLFDRSLHVVRSGIVRAHQGASPYKLVELRSNDARLPSPYRGRWILAVEYTFGVTHVDMDQSTADDATNHADDDGGSPAEPLGYYLSPVEWDDQPAKGFGGAGWLRDVSDLEVRQAEPDSDSRAQ